MKKIGAILFTACILGLLATTAAAKPRWINELTLQYSADGAPYVPMDGALAPGFVLYYNEAVNFYYLDVLAMTPVPDAGSYAFYIKTAPKGPYFEYMASRGVTADAAPGTWQAQMWLIITAQAPMFYLKSDGTQCDLIDGLLKDWAGVERPLRINGNYFVGTYHFIGEPVLDGQAVRTMIKLFFK
jgi:hypothetical protein